MKQETQKKGFAIVASLILMALATYSTSNAFQSLPNPVLVFMGSEDYEANGKQWTRYKYAVYNRVAYPNELFAPAPDLPPCGANARSSRTWVDIYDSRGKRLNGFCALTNRDGLGKLWFALEKGAIPPSWIYVEMTDRKTATKYKSNEAETIQ